MLYEYLGIFLAALFEIFACPFAKQRLIKHSHSVLQHFKHELLIFLLHAHERGFHSQHALRNDDVLFV